MDSRIRSLFVFALSAAASDRAFALQLGTPECSAAPDTDAPLPAIVVHTSQAVAADAPIVLSWNHIAFLADEATTGPGGSDLNQDADAVDSIAYVIDTATAVQTNLAVAASSVAWIGDELYLAVDEAQDARNWEPADTGNQLVLLHWSAAAPTLAFIDRLAPGGGAPMVARGDHLIYASATVPAAPTVSSLGSIYAYAPSVHSLVSTTDFSNSLRPRILREEEGLVFLALDETVEGRDLNGDGDATDTSILALLDITQQGAPVESTELAIPGPAAPVRALKIAAHDWHVGFLVSEAGSANTNLNDPALFAGSWKPPQCIGHEDADALDDVLHFLEFAAWDADPILNPPVNTGLASADRIAIVEAAAGNFIGAIAPEGSEGTCDLNQDGDQADRVFRWVRMTTPVLPLNAAANLHAVHDVPGSTHGVAELDGRFVILVSESDDDLDINGDALKTFDLLGWLAPSGAAQPWDFTHGPANNAFAGATWMAEQQGRTRLGVAFPENVAGVNINVHVPAVPGEDLDMLDSVPTFVDFVGGPTYLAFPGVAIAVDRTNAGIRIANNVGYDRVSESEDSRDWNGDGDEIDSVLFSTSLLTGVSAVVGDLNTIPGRAALEVDLQSAAPPAGAFIANEAFGLFDLNNDGDLVDLVLEWMILGEDCNQNGIPDDQDISNGMSSDVDSSGVPDECEVAGRPYCFGDSTGAPCPCDPGQSGGPGEGCANSTGVGGELAALGVVSVANDSLTLAATGLPPAALCLYFQGTTKTAGGLGVLHGDGLLCASGTVVRLGTDHAADWTSTFGFATGVSIAAQGQIPPVGATRYYQVLYRDSMSFCTPATFNETNGVRIVWSP